MCLGGCSASLQVWFPGFSSLHRAPCPSAGKLLLCGCASPKPLAARARSPVLPLGLCSFHPELVFRVIFSDVPPSLLLLLTCLGEEPPGSCSLPRPARACLSPVLPSPEPGAASRAHQDRAEPGQQLGAGQHVQGGGQKLPEQELPQQRFPCQTQQVSVSPVLCLGCRGGQGMGDPLLLGHPLMPSLCAAAGGWGLLGADTKMCCLDVVLVFGGRCVPSRSVLQPLGCAQSCDL